MMPKKTFLNLQVEKQNKVIKAAMKEFSNKPLKEASVANIIIDADIPRGSFYQYFNDIEDLYYYLLDFYAKDIKKHLIDALLRYQGDIMGSFIDLYKYVLDLIYEQDNVLYFENIFLNMSYKLERMFTPNLEDNLNDVINLIDISKLNIAGKLQLIYVLDIIEAVFMRNIIQSYKRNISKEKNVDIYIREMNYIKEGLYKS
jgi:AcrR family transcriptional regulator